MQNLKKNVILEGVFSAQSPDTSGEVLDVKGADISSLNDGTAFVNTEHTNPEDIEKADGDFKGFQAVVGKVNWARKIFTKEDCKTDRELQALKNLGVPLIYGQVTLFDGPEAHDNARAAASLARLLSKDKDTKLGLSVEGSTLHREGPYLKKTVIRKLALTLKPAFKAARIDVVQDDQASQALKPMRKTASVDGFEPLHKSINAQLLSEVASPLNDHGLKNAIEDLKKALTAGSGMGAPSSRTGGDALQKVFGLFKKPAKKAEILAKYPDLSDDQAEKMEKALKVAYLKKCEEEAKEAYKLLVTPQKNCK